MAYLPSVARALTEGFTLVEPAPASADEVRWLFARPAGITLRLAAAHTRADRVRREWRSIERFSATSPTFAFQEEAFEPAALGTPRTQGAPQPGSASTVSCPACRGQGGQFNEDGGLDPCEGCAGKGSVFRYLEREATDLVETHEYTYIPGRLGILDAELRGYIRVAGASFPDALKLALQARQAAGPYRDAPSALRTAFEDFDLAEAHALARGHQAGFTEEPTVAKWRYEAWALPVLLVGYGEEGKSTVVGLVSLRGTIDVLVASRG